MKDKDETEEELNNLIKDLDKQIDFQASITPILEGSDKVLDGYINTVSERPHHNNRKESDIHQTQHDKRVEETRRINDEWIRVGFREAKEDSKTINEHIVQIKKTLVVLHKILIHSMPKGSTVESHRMAHEIIAQKQLAEKEAKEDWVKLYKELKHKTLLALLWASGAFVFGLLGLGGYTWFSQQVSTVINKVATQQQPPISSQQQQNTQVRTK